MTDFEKMFEHYGFRNFDLNQDIKIHLQDPASEYDRLRAYDIDVSKEDDSLLAYYESAEKRARGLDRRIKPGKLIRKIFPHYNDVLVAQIADMLKEKYLNDFSGLRIYRSKAREDFAMVYKGQIATTMNPECNSWKKYLNSSCMRGEFSHMPAHPAEAYASGDFEIFWVTSSGSREGPIHARSVVGSNNTWGPIYTTSDNVTNLLMAHFQKLGFSRATDGSWNGLRFLEIKHNKSLIGPYLDLEPKNLSEDLVIGDGNKYRAVQTSGYLAACNHYCDHCDDDVEDETTFVTSVNYRVCEYCLGSDFWVSDYDNQYYTSEVDRVEVHRDRSYYSNTWTLEQAENNAIYCENEDIFVMIGYEITLHDETYAPRYLLGSTYVESAGNNEYYHVDDTRTLPCGCVISNEELNDA